MSTEKFQRATEFLYQGDQDAAAKLFNEGVAEEVARATPAAVNVDELVRTVTSNVQQQLVGAPAVAQLFENYPELKTKRAYAMMADEKVAEFVAKGEPLDEAIRKAGDAVAKEYGLGKRSQAGKHSQASRQSGASDEGEEDYPGVIAELRASRPGNR